MVRWEGSCSIGIWLDVFPGLLESGCLDMVLADTALVSRFQESGALDSLTCSWLWLAVFDCNKHFIFNFPLILMLATCDDSPYRTLFVTHEIRIC
jgi:hypothetical protein